VPLSRGELGPRLTQCGLGRGLLPYQVASSSIQPFGHNRRALKLGGGGCAVFYGGDESPSNTKSPGPRPTSISSGILVHPAVWPQRTLAENWGLCPFRGGGAGSPSKTMSPMLRPIPPSKWYPDTYSRLATIDIGRKLGVCVPFLGVSWVPI